MLEGVLSSDILLCLVGRNSNVVGILASHSLHSLVCHHCIHVMCAC